VDAKGDLLVGSADNTVVRVGVGSNDQVLMADSAAASGVKWAAVEAAGAVAAHEADTTNVHGIANTADLATKSYADTAAANAAAGVVNAAPAALDTLNELAAALGNDASFSTTTATALGNRVRVDAAQSFNGTQQAQARSNIGAAAATHASTHGSAGSDPITIAQSQVSNLSTDLSLKAPLASPTLTGTPSAPTASVGTDTTQIATTAFVNAEISNDAVLKSLADAKGDIFVATADNTVTRLAVGADATVLTADATTGTGVKWATVSVPDSGFNSFLLMGA
jgi:hypothetical protein